MAVFFILQPFLLLEYFLFFWKNNGKKRKFMKTFTFYYILSLTYIYK